MSWKSLRHMISENPYGAKLKIGLPVFYKAALTMVVTDGKVWSKIIPSLEDELRRRKKDD